MTNPASALVTASTRLLEDLAGGHRPLSSVSGSLADLATHLGVKQVMVAIDDAVYGRQVFSSGRTILGDHGALLTGPPRAFTVPPSTLDDALGRLIVASVAAAFERARTSPPANAAVTPAAPNDPQYGKPPSGNAPPGPTQSGRTSSGDLLARLRAATDRSARYGWGFTLVVLVLDRADDRSTRQIEAHLRASDTLVETGPREYAILLPAAGGDEVPRLLARVGRGGAVSTFCYGLAACPGDGTDPDALLTLAAARLRDAQEMRGTSEVHALEEPVV